jgi:hypothetical protein
LWFSDDSQTGKVIAAVVSSVAVVVVIVVVVLGVRFRMKIICECLCIFSVGIGVIKKEHNTHFISIKQIILLKKQNIILTLKLHLITANIFFSFLWRWGMGCCSHIVCTCNIHVNGQLGHFYSTNVEISLQQLEQLRQGLHLYRLATMVEYY